MGFASDSRPKRWSRNVAVLCTSSSFLWADALKPI